MPIQKGGSGKVFGSRSPAKSKALKDAAVARRGGGKYNTTSTSPRGAYDTNPSSNRTAGRPQVNPQRAPSTARDGGQLAAAKRAGIASGRTPNLTISPGRSEATTRRGAAERASVEGRTPGAERPSEKYARETGQAPSNELMVAANLKQINAAREERGSKGFSADAHGALSKSAMPGEKGGGGGGGFNDDQPRDSYGRWT